MIGRSARHGPLLLVVLVAIAAALVPAGCSRGGATPASRVFLITIDTLRADHLGSYGYPRGVSPFLDALGEDSVVFLNALSSSSHTAPSHASLFTSLYPAQHRTLRNGELLADDLRTIAEAFRDLGFQTAAFTPVKFLSGLSQGFDEFRAGTKYAPAQEVLGWTRSWLQQRDVAERQFVWIHLFDVHEWYQDHRVNRHAVAGVERDARLQGPELVAFLRQAHGLQGDSFPGRRGPVETINRYDGQLWHVDQTLKRFFNWVKDEGLYENSLWVITSDHGEGLGNHQYLGHGKYIYNEQLRVPLLIHSADGRFSPHAVEARVELVDIAPTLCAIFGTDFERQPVPIVGRSFLDLLEDSEASWQAGAAFSQRRPVDEKRLREGWAPGDVFTFQDDHRKVIVNTQGTTEIYDLDRDPFELDNLAVPPSAEQLRLVDELTDRYLHLVGQGNAVGNGEIQPEFVEELKALGYL